jgi:hypothetical protein
MHRKYLLIPSEPFTACEDLHGGLNRIVTETLLSPDSVVLANEGDVCVGVLSAEGNSGEIVAVATRGFAPVLLGERLEAGEVVMAGPGGVAVRHQSQYPLLGVLSVGGDVGELGTVYQ